MNAVLVAKFTNGRSSFWLGFSWRTAMCNTVYTCVCPGEDYENRMVEGAPIRRTPVLLRRGSPCTLPAGKIAAGGTVAADACMLGSALHWPGTLELLGCTALPSGCGSRLGTGHLCCKVQCCACRDSGDRLAENTVAAWESETRMEATSPAQRAVRCLSFAQRPPLVLWVFR